MAAAQGFEIPPAWFDIASKKIISLAIGNAVPVYMSRAFGEAIAAPHPKQLELFT